MSDPSPNPIIEESDIDEFDIYCEACEPEEQALDQTLHFCYACDVTLCERCWNVQLQHRRAKIGKSVAIHEKANPWIARQINNILSPPTDELSYARLCAADESTAWFGIDRGRRTNDPLYLKDSGRYAQLMAQTRDENSIRFSWNSEGDQTASTTKDSRTPSLASFVGQSGAGKSTLINFLITFKGGVDRGALATPVVGMTGKDIPTSEDVHLYPDPASVYSSAPILYADCEGLDGGEREPVGARFRKARTTSPDARIRSSAATDYPVYVSSRELVWATEDASRRTRSFAVANLYPRLLFSFSDTVVFVLKNPRVIEGVFERLIEWASAALEAASNQPVLPAAVIALNATEINVEPELWDVERGTRSLLDSLATTVRENSTFKKHVEFWAYRNKRIESLEQLVLCYFSSIEVVRIPATGRPKLLQIQIEKLYDAIDRGCVRARERKLSLRMLLNAGEMQSYLQHAFDHFSQTLDEAFDFVRASLFNSPIPLDFGGNILRLALNVMDYKTQARQKIEAAGIFRELARMVASCIMLDSVRHEIRGNAERIFPEYLEHIHSALADFCNHHWPCEFTITRARCCNVRSGHGSKGHQTRRGIVFAAGEYQAAFTYENYKNEFETQIFKHLEWLMRLLEDRIRRGEDDVSAANGIHREETLRSFYANVFQDQENATFTHSHGVCLGCGLFERPEHTLPCGHMLCSVCVRSYGESRNDLLVEMHHCPLEIDAPPLRRTIAVYLKPDAASSRVLTLDHGGVRSMIQLEVLKLLEEEWMNKLSIRCFFDLIVGSGSGGLVALGLTTRGWSVKKCMYHIERIFTHAFTKRHGRNIPGIGKILQSASKEKYDTAGLEYALKEAFGEDDPLFGALNNRDSPSSTSDVAVVASSVTGTPVLLASYNRRCIDPLPYIFRRPEKPEQELKLWEAARATISTPKLFKPFLHEATKHIYCAAGPPHLNPIYIADSERRIFKQELRNPDAPDLIISLGAGVEEELVDHSKYNSWNSSETPPNCSCDSAERKTPSRTLTKRRTSFLKCQSTSDDFIHDFPSSAKSHLRFVRFNPRVSEKLPSSDDLGSLEELRDKIRSQIDKNEIKALAAKLLAALFYYETIGDLAQQADGTWMSTGMIRCRIPNDTVEMSSLGKLLRKKTGTSFPRFVIRDDEGTTQIFSMTADTTADMVLNSKFSMPPIEIDIPQRSTIVDIMLFFENTDRNSISGFPRTLGKPSNKVNRHRQALSSKRSDTASIGSSLRSRSTGRSWQVPQEVRRAASPAPSEEIIFSPAAAGMNIPRAPGSSGRGRKGPATAVASPTNSSFTGPKISSRSRSSSNKRPLGPKHEQKSGPKTAGSDSDTGLALSPNFNTGSFHIPPVGTSAFTSFPRERKARGYETGDSSNDLAPSSSREDRGLVVSPTTIVAGSSVTSSAGALSPREVMRNVKMMSTHAVNPTDMKIILDENNGHYDENYDDDEDAETESMQSPRGSMESRRDEESVQHFEERLRQLEGIIRSKERIDVDQIRDSLKDEVLLGQGGKRVGKAQ
ncbi:uncharacterized protein PV09_03974 [Verruconis gallopava]|uniref:PNPLA domain-containing protein n=1 Tax=Verruconis gallopava TaxID=253628 RepID=A0A0D1XQA7_9PEZI|nr:uncharacterized protein PV09_03974 [Verruconis gallopava]KIW04786.1 hypothetical protein PV09_03974 [Verruconis gallopava]